MRGRRTTDTAGPFGSAGSGAPPDAELLAVRMVSISKRFEHVRALDDVSFEVRAGEVHALLGENGAGKSTLMRVLAGFVRPDSGDVLVRGSPVAFSSPRDALRSGIGMVHQHFRLVETFTVAENLALGSPELPELVNARRLRAAALTWAERYQMKIDPDVRVSHLSMGERQRTEILRTLSHGAKVIILDEPTAVLTPDEADVLCGTLRQMAAAGHTIVFISHKLREVLAVADRITVMRHGRALATLTATETDSEQLARLMIGTVDRGPERPARRTRAAQDALRVDHLTVLDNAGMEAVKDATLHVRPGEIAAVVGVAGNGQSELAEALTGLRRIERGSVDLSGVDLTRAGVVAHVRAGVGYIPEDRMGSGLVPGEPIWRNAILRAFRDDRRIGRGPILRRRAARDFARTLCELVKLSTRNVDVQVRHLSGGNAQRLLTGRELTIANLKLVVAVNPTQGLDLQAQADVWRRLLDARELGTAVLLITGDLDEAMAIADRIAVIYEGRILWDGDVADAERAHVGLLMGGGTSHRAEG